MSLDDFLEECKKNGATPISYESRSDPLFGSRYERWDNPAFKNKATDSLRSLLRDEGGEVDDLFSMMYSGKDVVIRNRDGYHYGRLIGYDSRKRFYILDGYYFSNKLMDELSYVERIVDFLGGCKVAIPADNLISVSEIPSCAEEMTYF